MNILKSLKCRLNPLFVVLLLNLGWSLNGIGAPVENSCSNLFEKFCEKVWSKENMGNLDIQVDKKIYPLRLGHTKNDIGQARHAFYSAVLERYPHYPQEFRKALNKNNVAKKIKRLLNRKPRSEFSTEDIGKEEWHRNVAEDIRDATEQVADLRTEKQLSGFLKKRHWDLTPEMKMIRSRNRDIAESEFFQSTWENTKNWKETEKTFEVVRKEYILWMTQNEGIPPALKNDFIEDLQTLKLIIPGSNPARMSKQNRECAIDDRNAFYNPLFHTVTVCAGTFNAHDPLLTIAHEMGHSIGPSRRLFKYRSRSDYGKQLIGFWQQSCGGKNLSCDQRDQFKKDFSQNADSLKPYEYYDESFLSGFLSKNLEPIPKKRKLEKVAERLSKKTMRSAAEDGDIARVLKEISILPTGEQVKNFEYMNSCQGVDWWLPADLIFSEPRQFMSFFTNEYSCQKEKESSELDALKKAIDESTRLIQYSWLVNLTVGGKYSEKKEAVDENYAQVVEEDVADNYASQVTARILRNTPNQESRRDLFFAMASARCDPPSFRKVFPAEYKAIRSLTNLSHSSGLDRRIKILIKDVNEVLGCQ